MVIINAWLNRMQKNLKTINNLSKSGKYIFYRKSVVLTKDYIGKTVKIHNGKDLIERKVTSQMLGLKIGQLILTRSLYEHDKKKKKKKKKKKIKLLWRKR